MKELEIYPRGSSRTRIREQMDRLFNASISLVYENESNKTSINTQIAARTEFWWNERKPDERTLWQSKVVLSHEFFHEIVFHPVPLDMNILKALRRSPLGLDLYVWLNYRTFGLGACRELAPSKQESTTYEPSPVCKLLILGCRLLIADRLLGACAAGSE